MPAPPPDSPPAPPALDRQLLEQYVQAQDQQAFAELVHRHVNLVHAAARRQTPQAADDVTQAVFLLLAQKAARLPRNRPLAGWLCQATRYCCANVKRDEALRRRHEREAATMAQLHTAPPDKNVENLLPLLDEALATLSCSRGITGGGGGGERDAVVLRYLEGKSFAETGAELSITSEAAGKRAGRGLDKLRAFFAKRGYIVPAAAVAGLLTAESAHAAPAALAAKVVVMGAPGAVVSAQAAALAKGASAMMTWVKVKLAAAIVVTAIVTGGAGTVVLEKTLGQSGSPPVGGTSTTSPAGNRPGMVYITGAAARPGTYTVELPAQGLTLKQLLAAGGGLTRGTGDASIMVIRRKPGNATGEQSIERTWGNLLNDPTADLTLENNDVVKIRKVRPVAITDVETQAAVLDLAAHPQRPPRSMDAEADAEANDTHAQFSGQVIDAQTGQPVEHFTLEWGWPSDPKDPATVVWGGASQSTSGPTNGEFNTFNGWQKGQKVGLRVLAEGYLPEPVTPQLVTTPSNLQDLVVKLKRGTTVRGIVLDHAGKPVTGAEVFVAGAQQIVLREGPLTLHGAKSTFMTDKNGHFAITGAGPKDQQLVISAPGLHAWMVTVADPTGEVTITLPEPAALAIRYNIPGAPDEADFLFELTRLDLPQWQRFVSVRRYPKVTNGQTTTLSDLTPGTYNLARHKLVWIGDHGRAFLCERRMMTLESGKQAEAVFARAKGASVHGTVEGLAQANLPGVFIQVRSGDATTANEGYQALTRGPDGAITGETSNGPAGAAVANERYDALTCNPDGAFTTETLAPGTYSIVVEAYGPERLNAEDFYRPDYVGVGKVTIPETGEPPEVKVQVKPRSEGRPATGIPGTPPAGK